MNATTAGDPTGADITGALRRAQEGAPQALDAVFPLVYAALRQIAHRHCRRRDGEALTTTALVHETWLDLVGRDARQWPDRAHFYAYAGRAMRSILVDDARRRQSLKRDGELHGAEVDAAAPVVDGICAELLALDAALTRLAALDGDLVKVVELRYFAGLAVADVAAAMGIAPRSVDRLWQKARLLLAQFLA